jgi:hypothetical protein
MLRYRFPLGGRFVWLFVLATTLGGCTTTSEQVPAFHSGRQERPSGFVDRLLDAFSERECNVGRFTCSYGLGSAGEPCDCVGPGNVVFKGYTIK